jgi:hypothetical protein
MNEDAIRRVLGSEYNPPVDSATRDCMRRVLLDATDIATRANNWDFANTRIRRVANDFVHDATWRIVNDATYEAMDVVMGMW